MEHQADQLVEKDFIGGMEKKECHICKATETPQNHWRSGPKGPQGPKILCNACGLRYKYGKKTVNNINLTLGLGTTPNPKKQKHA